MKLEQERIGDYMYLRPGSREIVRQKTAMAFGTSLMIDLKNYLREADDVKKGKTVRGKPALIGIKNGHPMKPFNVGNMKINQ